MAISDADILAYVQANINDPGAIAAAAAQYGVSLDDLSRATGYDAGTVNNYFSSAGIDTSNLAAIPQRVAPLPEPQSYTQPEPTPPPAPVVVNACVKRVVCEVRNACLPAVSLSG